jgi:hypothetical protein
MAKDGCIQAVVLVEVVVVVIVDDVVDVVVVVVRSVGTEKLVVVTVSVTVPPVEFNPLQIYGKEAL